MKCNFKIWICNNEGEKTFGEGPYLILKGIQEMGSLRKAAMSMDMAYTKALKIIKRAEKNMGYKLTERTIGGQGGGGSKLTDNATVLMERYEELSEISKRESQKFYEKHKD